MAGGAIMKRGEAGREDKEIAQGWLGRWARVVVTLD